MKEKVKEAYIKKSQISFDKFICYVFFFFLDIIK